jgi:surfactin synthase thioesterase subunit
MTVDAWFLCFRRRPEAKLRLLAFPYAGGGASIFRTWGDALPPSVEVMAVQPPGRETRINESPYQDLGRLVASLASAVRSQMSLPTVFFGHSMGAILAFELTRQLRRIGAAGPVHLVLSAHRAPHLPERMTDLHALPEPDLIRAVGERYQPIPEAILAERELLDLTLPTLRADLKLGETWAYSAEEPLSIPLSVFGGTRDPVADESEVRAWSSYTTGLFSPKFFDGDHFFVTDPRTKPFVLQALADVLAEVAVRGLGSPAGANPSIAAQHPS